MQVPVDQARQDEGARGVHRFVGATAGKSRQRGGHAFAKRDDDTVAHQQVAAGDRAGRVHADERAGMEEAAAQAGASLR